MEKFAIAVSSALVRLEQSSSSPSARGGALRYRGGRTRVTLFAEEGVFFLRPPHFRDFVKEGYFFVPRYEVWGSSL